MNPSPDAASKAASQAAGESAPAKPIAAVPATSEPATTEPVATEPVAIEPVATEPIATEPVATEPVATEPVATEPVATEPVTTEPVTTEPVITEPAATEPAATEPAATEPAATEPAATEPAATEPAATEPISPKPVPTPSTSSQSPAVALEPAAPNQTPSVSKLSACEPTVEHSRESFAEPSSSASRTPSSESEDGDTVVDDLPTKQPKSPASASAEATPTTLNIIHSVANPAAVPPLSPLSDATSSTPRSGFFSIFSPRNAKSTSPLRRLFSPRWFSSTPVDHRQTESTMTTTPPWRKNLACCFVRQQTLDESLPDYDYVEQLKNLEPTYEPEPPLLPSPSPHAKDRICLVLDLDETLVHSSFTPLPNADFEIPLDMQGEIHTVYVKKRPGVDNFLKKASEWFEIVIFTASLALYANPVVDLLDPHNLVELRLYREHCVLIGGCYVKDIAKLGRDLKRTVIIDNSPLSYVLQPENAIPISAFFTDDNDRELDKTLSLLEQTRNLEDVRKVLA